MKKLRQLHRIIVFALIVTSLALVTLAGAATKITILQTTDMHGRIYPHDYALDAEDQDVGLAKIKVLLDQERALNPNAIVIDCGDTLQDNSAELFNDLPTHPMIRAMNMMNYDVWTLGNHEFNFGLEFLEKNIKAFNGAVLSANIYRKDTSERWVLPYKIFNRKGVRVAVVGMLPPAIPTWESTTPQHVEGLVFTDPTQETEKVLQELEGKYDVLVGAYHIGPDGEQGYDGLEVIANKYPQFDVLFAGHAHAKYNNEINGVKIVEPGKYGWALAKADIEVVKEGESFKVAYVSTANLETKGIASDQHILATFKDVHETSVADANLVVGKITQDFVERVDFVTGAAEVTTMPTAQLTDTAIIDLINTVQMHFTGAEVSSAALFNFGSNLKAGDFKKKDVAYIYKYPNTLVGVNISGANLKKYMEWSAAYYNTFKPGDLTISFNGKIRGYNYDMFAGVTYEIDISQEAQSRIKNAQIAGKPLDASKQYRLAVNNYRFGTLLKLGLVTEEDKYYDSIANYPEIPDGRIRDLIIKYTKETRRGTLDPEVDHNWKLVGYSIDASQQAKAFEMIKIGALTIPSSKDGRTLNIRSITVADLK